MEQEEETADLDREEVLKMNRVQMRYSRAEIEAFIESLRERMLWIPRSFGPMSEEEFEKLILAYDYSIRRNGRFTALEEGTEMVQNGKYRYPHLKFIQRRPE